MDHTHTRPATRLHVSGDPESGWIAEVHDDSEPVVWQSGGTPDRAAPHPKDVETVLDRLHGFYEEVKGKAIEDWDSLKAHFLDAWDEKHPQAAAQDDDGQEDGDPNAQAAPVAGKPKAKAEGKGG